LAPVLVQVQALEPEQALEQALEPEQALEQMGQSQ
jgi:hypothetical protein